MAAASSTKQPLSGGEALTSSLHVVVNRQEGTSCCSDQPRARNSLSSDLMGRPEESVNRMEIAVSPISPSQPPKKSRVIYWIIAIGFLTVSAAYLWTAYGQRYVLTDEPDVVRDAGGVRIGTDLSSRDLDPGDGTLLEVEITNRSGRILNRPWISASLPAFAETPINRTIKPDIQNGESRRIPIPLRAGSTTGQFRGRVTVGWTAGTETVVDLTPPLVVVRNAWSRIQWIATGLQAICKDLALPFILAIVAAVFQGRKDDEARALAERQRRDDRLRDTWTLMLQKHHQNAELYYLPLLSAIRDFRRALAEADETKGFYFFITICWRFWQLSQKIGGLYFKNRDAEVLLALIWRVIVTEADYRFGGRANRELAIEKLTVRKAATPINYAAFSTGTSPLQSQPPFDTLLPNFRTWRAEAASADHLTVGDIESLLAIFRSVADFETNRPYEYWYNQKPEFPGDEVAEFAGKPVARHALMKEVRIPFERYYSGIRKDFDAPEVTWPWQKA